MGPGTVVGEKYEVVGLIARGGMSRVWLARDLRLNKLWAVKEVERGAAGDAAFGHALEEARLMRGLDHPALPRIVDICSDGRAACIVMDYIEGRSLRQVLEESGPQRPADVVRWGAELCEALTYLHTREPPIVYRDMKPGNVVLREDGSVRLIDFGIAREYKLGASADTCVLGTRGYAAPEQMAEGAQTDARTDVYSLGATLYALLTGLSPAREAVMRPLREVDPSLGEGLEHVILKATDPDPAKRYQSCAEMRRELVAHEKLSRAYREGLRRRVGRFAALAAAGAACALGGAGCLIGAGTVRSQAYESRIEAARSASAEARGDGRSEAEEAYGLAIQAEPGNPEAYRGLIDGVYKADMRLTAAEAARLSGLLEANLPALASSGGYASLCYEVGMLYGVYYELDADAAADAAGSGRPYAPAADEKAALWLERALEADSSGAGRGSLTEAERSLAEAYRTMARFPRVLERSTLEGGEGEACAEYWAALEEAFASVGEGAPVMARLRLCEAALGSLCSPTCLAGFKRGGVDEGRVRKLASSAEAMAGAASGEASSSAVSEGLARSLAPERWARARDAVASAYGAKPWEGAA